MRMPELSATVDWPTNNPCADYAVLDEAWRNVQHGTEDQCDDGFAGEWYRFMEPAGTAMPTEAPPNWNRCGADAPMWMNGEHPTLADGVVSRQACGYFLGNTCRYQTTIQVRACSAGYFVYKLPAPPGCSFVYCGASEASAQQTTEIPTTTSPTSTTVRTTQATSTQSQVSSTPRLTQQSTLPGTTTTDQTTHQSTLPGTTVSEHPWPTNNQTAQWTTLPGTTVSEHPTNQTAQQSTPPEATVSEHPWPTNNQTAQWTTLPTTVSQYPTSQTTQQSTLPGTTVSEHPTDQTTRLAGMGALSSLNTLFAVSGCTFFTHTRCNMLTHCSSSSVSNSC
ncbi:uncharacterized protein LOC144903752 [Branchiostoma floridae x Branchiostoma belcheri]